MSILLPATMTEVGIGIGLRNDIDLYAYTRCCLDKIINDPNAKPLGYAHDDWWICNMCKIAVNQPARPGHASSIFTIREGKTIAQITHWVSHWTRINEDLLQVEITFP